MGRGELPGPDEGKELVREIEEPDPVGYELLGASDELADALLGVIHGGEAAEGLGLLDRIEVEPVIVLGYKDPEELVIGDVLIDAADDGIHPQGEACPEAALAGYEPVTIPGPGYHDGLDEPDLGNGPGELVDALEVLADVEAGGDEVDGNIMKGD